MTRGRFPIPGWLLAKIADRDRYRCHICDQGYIAGEKWEIDHDIALAKGGTNHVRNLRLSHRSCNRAKADA